MNNTKQEVKAKWLAKRTYTFDDKKTHTTYRIPCRYSYTEEQVSAILRKVKTFLANYVYVPCVISDCIMIMLQRSLQKKGLYRFKTKKDFVEIQTATRKIIKAFDDDFLIPEYFDELSMSYYDEVEHDIKKFQKFIEVKLANLGHKNVGLAAMSYLSFQFLCEGFLNYNTIILAAKDDYDLDFKELFSSLCLEHVCDKGKCFMEAMGLSEDFVRKFNEKEEVAKMFRDIERIFLDKKVQKKVSQSARQAVNRTTCDKMDEGGKKIQDTLSEINGKYERKE